MNRVRRSLCLAAVAALPFTIGAGVANAEGVSAGQDRLHLDTNTNLTDGDQFLVDVRAVSIDDNGDATGVRSRTTSSDILDVENVRSDNRTVSNDEGNDSTSGRAILGIDGLRGLDEIESDIDLVTIDGNDDENTTDANADQVAGQSDATDEQQYGEDAEFVLGE